MHSSRHCCYYYYCYHYSFCCRFALHSHADGRRWPALLPLTTFHLHSSRQHIAACNMQRAALIIVSVCCCCWQFSNSWRAQNYTHFHSRLKCIPFSCMRKLPRNVAYGICKTQTYSGMCVCNRKLKAEYVYMFLYTFVQIRTCSYSIFSKNVYSIAGLYSFVLLTVLASSRNIQVTKFTCNKNL